MRPGIFWVDGEISPDSPLYIEREADREALLALLRMAYISIPTPRQQGTTSLIKRLSRHPLLANFSFVYLDTTRFDWSSETQWYWSVYSSLSRSIPDLVPESWVHCPLNLSGCRTFLSVIATRASSDGHNVVIALDKFGVVWKEWAASFLSVLRSLYTLRSIKMELNYVTFVIAGPFIPDKLTKQVEISPFNVAETIELTDFTEDQVRLLVSHLGYWDERTALLAKCIWSWTCGQPYLTQLICQKLSEIGHAPLAEDVDKIAQNLHQEDQKHIVPLLDRWITDSRLVAYTQRILNGERIRFFPFGNRRQGTLALLGILKADVDGYCTIRNRIYERALAGISGETSSSPTPSPALHPGLNNALNHHASEPTVTLPDSQSSIGGKDMDYERGFQALKKCLAGTSTELQSELATVEERFWKNERAGRIFGSSENTRNECSQVIFSLNELALKHCGVSFNALCRGELPLASKKPSLQEAPVPASPPHRPSSGTTYHITITGDGNVVGDGSGAQVIHRETSSAPETVSPPGVSVTLLTRIFPTAYCHNLIAETFPLVTIVLDNTGRGCDNTQVSAEAVVQGYSEPAVASLLVPRGQQAQVALLPMLRHKAVATLNEIRPASLRVTIHQHHTGRPQLLHDHTYPLQLHARDTALLAVKAPDGSTVDLTDYLVAWVTPHRPEIERLLRQAAEHHPDQQFIGYQGASKLTEAAVVVREQARAIFAVLKQDANLVYINSPLNLGTQDGQVTQRVRLPTESLAAGSSANCIDGTVLFASLLELASIEPLIVLVPRHTFVGWRTWSGVDRYEFLETTMIGNADFDAAQKSAQARYDEVLLKGYLSRGLFDPGGFARLIDVAACRTKGIHPLE